jgi:SAM-dependent methyltransferase
MDAKTPKALVAKAMRKVRGPGGVSKDEKSERHRLVGPAHLWKEKREWQIAFLLTRGLRRSDRFLDVGCGTLRGGIPIIDYLDEGNYTGIDVRPIAIEEAKKELAGYPNLAEKNARLILSTGFDTLPDLGLIDRAWSFSVLIHMQDDISSACLLFLGRTLRPGGIYNATANLGETHTSRIGKEGFPVFRRPIAFYAELAEAAGLTMEDLGTLRSLGHELNVGDDHHMLEFQRPA